MRNCRPLKIFRIIFLCFNLISLHEKAKTFGLQCHQLVVHVLTIGDHMKTANLVSVNRSQFVILTYLSPFLFYGNDGMKQYTESNFINNDYCCHGSNNHRNIKGNSFFWSCLFMSCRKNCFISHRKTLFTVFKKS